MITHIIIDAIIGAVFAGIIGFYITATTQTRGFAEKFVITTLILCGLGIGGILGYLSNI